MGAFLDVPATDKQAYDGYVEIDSSPSPFFPSTTCTHSIHHAQSNERNTQTPQQKFLIQFGGATMQGWRKYQEDRLSYMQVASGRLPTGNFAPNPAIPLTPSPAGIHMLFLSVFDGHGGADTSEHCHQNFHLFLKSRVEARMAQARSVVEYGLDRTTSIASTSKLQRRHSAADATAAPTRNSSFQSSTSTSSIFPPPPYPLDSEFITQVFLDFDKEIPLPEVETPKQPSGGMLRRPAPGNTLPHLASGTTATVCIIDFANGNVVIAHIGDSRAVVFNSVRHMPQIPNSITDNAERSLSSTGKPNANRVPSNVNRMSPVSEEDLSPTAGSSPAPTDTEGNSSSAPSSGSSKSNKSNEKHSRSMKSSSRRREPPPSAEPSLEHPSCNFIVQYASRDHHPDDPIEQQRIQTGQFESTFLNHHPPSKSRVCHGLQRISLNVVRGFGDAWFKLEDKFAWRDQMVNAVPDYFSVKFPLAVPAPNAVIEDDGFIATRQRTISSSHARADSPTNSRSTTPVLGPASSPKSFVAPAGETLYIVLASDGIWNSEFKPGTPGVNIKHGSETSVKKAKEEKRQKKKSATGANKPMLTHKPSIALTQGAADSDSSSDEEPLKRTSSANQPANADSDDSDDSSSDWSSSDSEDDEYPEQQVTMAVSQFFYNRAQQIVDKRLNETNAHSASTNRNTHSTVALPSRQSYSSIVSEALDVLMAHPPLNKNNVKSTDNMSAWLISITPVNVAAQAHTHAPRTEACESLSSRYGTCPNVLATSAIEAHGSLIPNSPATPRFFNTVTPPLVHQNSLPVMHATSSAHSTSVAGVHHTLSAPALSSRSGFHSPPTPRLDHDNLHHRSMSDEAPTPKLDAHSSDMEDVAEGSPLITAPSTVPSTPPVNRPTAASRKRRRKAESDEAAIETESKEFVSSHSFRERSRSEAVDDLLFSDSRMSDQDDTMASPEKATNSIMPTESKIFSPKPGPKQRLAAPNRESSFSNESKAPMPSPVTREPSGVRLPAISSRTSQPNFDPQPQPHHPRHKHTRTPSPTPSPVQPSAPIDAARMDAAQRKAAAARRSSLPNIATSVNQHKVDTSKRLIVQGRRARLQPAPQTAPTAPTPPVPAQPTLSSPLKSGQDSVSFKSGQQFVTNPTSHPDIIVTPAPITNVVLPAIHEPQRKKAKK